MYVWYSPSRKPVQSVVFALQYAIIVFDILEFFFVTIVSTYRAIINYPTTGGNSLTDNGDSWSYLGQTGAACTYTRREPKEYAKSLG